MKIETVKKIGDCFLVNKSIHVPVNKNNYHYLLVEKWLKANKAESEFSEKELLESAKAAKVAKINKNCEMEIEIGFYSTATSQKRFYRSNRDDQSNLIGLVALNMNSTFKASASPASERELIKHTAAQLKKVAKDGAIHKTALLQQAHLLKKQVSQSLSVDEVNKIKAKGQ